jgi:predicted Ser/Thr protein kinase
VIGPVVRRAAPPLPGKIGRYRITSRLGKGAMGVVYGARDEQMERDVALKVMMTDLEGEPETRARFFREAQITSGLLHRNIVTVFDIGEDDGRPFIVMELLRGRTVSEFLKEAVQATLEQKLDLMIQTCEGLSVAHAKGVVHRDIKPGNLFVLADGGLKIVDFGVARLASSSMTASGLIVGTPDYMSPEQARGREVDSRSDIFSAAAVFYFMVTGRKPFEGHDLPVVLQKVVREDPLPLREHEAPASLARIIARALCKEPERRYQKAADMTADLVRFKRHFDTETRQIGTAARERFDEILRAAATVRQLRTSLGLALDAVDERVADTKAKFPFFCPGADGRAPAVAPFRRSRLTAVMSDLQGMLEPVARELEALQGAVAAVEEGDRALESRDGRKAIAFFDRAAALAAGSVRIAEGAATARALDQEQRSRGVHVDALLAEAREAEHSGAWAGVVARCDEALAADARCAEALTMGARARSFATADAESRARRVDDLVAQAAASIQIERFDRAERFILDALAIDSANASAQAAQARLTAAQAAVAAVDAQSREAAETVRAARAAFDAGDHESALAQLDAILLKQPGAPGVASERDRLRAESVRRVEASERRANAEAHAVAANSHWSAGEIGEALKAAELALSFDRGHGLALRVLAQANVRLREQAAAAAREIEAASHVAKAAEFVSAGRFERAAREAQRALDLHPGRADAAKVIADARRLAAETETARQRVAATRERDSQVEKILKSARSAMRSGEYARAVYTVENALLLNPEHSKAKDLLAEARAARDAASAPTDSDDTVRATPEGASRDADSTAVVGRTAGVRELATGLGDWAASLRRRLQSPRGQTTTEWLMIAGIFTATAVFLGTVMPGALKSFLWGLNAGIKSLAP